MAGIPGRVPELPRPEQAPRHHPGCAHRQAERWPLDGLRLFPLRVYGVDGAVYAPGPGQSFGGQERAGGLAAAQEALHTLLLLVKPSSQTPSKLPEFFVLNYYSSFFVLFCIFSKISPYLIFKISLTIYNFFLSVFVSCFCFKVLCLFCAINICCNLFLKYAQLKAYGMKIANTRVRFRFIN